MARPSTAVRARPVPAVDELCALGRAHGLDAVGVTRAAPFASTRRHLEERKARGLHGGMAFTYRAPERSTDPRLALPEARTLVVGARSYLRERPSPGAVRDAEVVEVVESVGGAAPVGAVARYAWADYYGELREALTAVARRLRDGGWRARVLADDNALVDREAARRAGLGWYGKNANLLLPGQGSWFVLGAVVTDAPLDIPESRPVPDGCGSCTRCLDGCPTQAIVAPGVVDARRCLAWLLQMQGPFPREHRVALGDRLYGCDDCQEVCPPNRVAVRRSSARPAVGAPVAAEAQAGGDAGPAVEAAGEREVGAAVEAAGERETSAAVEAEVDLLALLAASDDELLARHGRWYVPRREARYLRRNALVVLGNVGDPASPGVVSALAAALADDDAMVRAHAVWAARRLGRLDLLPADDPDPLVRDELVAPVEVRT